MQFLDYRFQQLLGWVEVLNEQQNLQWMEEPRAAVRIITPGYFRTIQIPLQQGRYFTSGDNLDAPGVVIINEAAAKKYWPNENPINQRLRIHISLVDLKSEPRLIVGVVGNVKSSALSEDPVPELLHPARTTSC